MRTGRLLPLLLGLIAGPANAQAIVASPGPDRVAVTVYRDPNRGAEVAPNLAWLNGYALISETRRIAIPAGESDIRFEGVAGAILPQSAIVSGLPEGVVERNRDAYLLSAGSLLDRSLGRRVHLRRTSRATGAVREQDAIIRSGADGAVVLETRDGFEALRCTGQRETLVYDEVPAALSARPTLSVRARSSRALTATVTLSYLASGFDWTAYYVATLAPDGDRIDLFAWLTLANGDETGFANADTQAVAGQLNRSQWSRLLPEAPPLYLRCWRTLRTSDIFPDEEEDVVARPNLTSVSPVTVVNSQEIRLGGRRAALAPPPLIAQQEELGDLKLYRIPEPVTVAARSQKQVALLQRSDVPVRFVYRQRLLPTDEHEPRPARRLLLARNTSAEGLGLPLPSGPLALFDSLGERPILVAQAMVRDHAVGEEVELELGPASGVITEVRTLSSSRSQASYELIVTNDRSRPARFEGSFWEGRQRFRSATPLPRRDGMPLWEVTIPANSSVTLRYRLVGRP
jgi:hypothetical protein